MRPKSSMEKLVPEKPANTAAPVQTHAPVIIRTILILLLLFSLSFLLRYPYHRHLSHRLNRQHNCRPPPKLTIRTMDPLLGIDVVVRLRRAVAGRRFLRFLVDDVFHASSRIWTQEVNLLGRASVWTADPDVIRTILVTRAKDWHVGDARRKLVRAAVGDNIFTLEGAGWKHSRATMRPAFTRTRLGGLVVDMRKHVDRLVALLPRDGETVVDLMPLFYLLSGDVVTEFLYGLSINKLATIRDLENLKSIGGPDLIQQNIVQGKWVGKLGKLFSRDKKLQEATDSMNTRLDRFIQMVKELPHPSNPEDHEVTKSVTTAPSDGANPRPKYSVLHELIREWPTDPKRVRSEALILLVAGKDTTASTLSNMFFWVARNPGSWRKLREECLAFDSENPTFDDLKGLKYTNDCVREGLRMLNPTIDLNRTAAVDTTLPSGGGPDGTSPMFVPKGTSFHLWLYVMHHRKDIWGDDADEFRPERWQELGPDEGHETENENGEKANRNPLHCYSPFGAGTRICIGQQQALTEILYTTFRLARRFSGIQPADPEPWTETLGFATSSANGTKVRLIP